MAGLAQPAAVAPPRPFVLSDLLVLAAEPSLRWEPLAPGVEAHRLYQWPTGQSAALLRYTPGARLRRHRHTGTEQIFVLSGSQADDLGRHSAGALVVHPAGSSHSIESDEGCLVLAIWEKPVEFVD